MSPSRSVRFPKITLIFGNRFDFSPLSLLVRKQKPLGNKVGMAEFSPYVVKVPGPTDPKFGWLSTSSNHPFRLDGKFYPTVEHYFLSKKFEGTVLEERIRTASSVSKLKILTRPRMHIFRDAPPGAGPGTGSTGVAEKKIVYGDEKVFARGDWVVSKKFHLERAIRAKLHDNPKLEARFATIEGLKIVDEISPDAATIWEKIRGERSAASAAGAGTAAKIYSVKNPKVDLRSAMLTPAETLFLQKLATGGPKTLPKKLSYIPALPVIEKWVASLPFSRVIQSQPVYAGLVRNVQHLLFGSGLVDETESRTRLKISILAAAVIRWLRLDADPDDVSKIFAASKTIATNELPVLYDFSPHGPSIFSLPGDEKILVSGPSTGDFFEVDSIDPDSPSVTFSKKALKKVTAHIYESKPETRILGWLCERLRWLISARIFAYSVAGRDSDDFFRTLPRPESGDFFPERKIQELCLRLKPEVSPAIFSSVSKNYAFVSDPEVENPDEVSGLIDSEATISEDAFLGVFARFASSRNVEKVDPEKILSSILLPELFSKWRVFVSKNSVPKPDTSEVKKWRRKFPSPSEGRIPKSWVRTLSTAVDFFRTEAENASAWVTLSVWSPIFPPEKIRTTTSEVEDPGVTFATLTEVEKENPDLNSKKSSSRERRRQRGETRENLLEIEDRPKPPGGEVIEISPDPTPELLEVCSANSSHPQSPVARYGFEKVWIVVIANSTSIAVPQGRLVAGKGNRSEGVTKRVYTAFPGVNVYSTPGREGAYPLGEAILSKPGEFERHRPNVATLIAEYSAGAPKKNTDSVEARKEWFSKSLGVLVERLSNDPAYRLSEKSDDLPILVFSTLTLHPEGYSELVGNLATEKGFTIYLVPEKPTEVATKTRAKKPEPTVIPVD